MQQQKLETGNTYPEIDPGTLATEAGDCEEAGIDQTTLARLDIGLFRCLSNLGTSKQRICSALCLSYAEYEYISRHLKGL